MVDEGLQFLRNSFDNMADVPLQSNNHTARYDGLTSGNASSSNLVPSTSSATTTLPLQSVLPEGESTVPLKSDDPLPEPVASLPPPAEDHSDNRGRTSHRTSSSTLDATILPVASTAQAKSSDPSEGSAAPSYSDNRQVHRPSTSTGSIEQPSVNLPPSQWPSKLEPPPSPPPPPPHPLDDVKKKAAIMENRREHSTAHASNHQSQAKPSTASSRQQSGAFAPGFCILEEDPRPSSARTNSSVGSPTVDGEQPGLDSESDSDDSTKGENPGYCNACGRGAFFLQSCDKCKLPFHLACLYKSRSTGPKHCHPCVRSLIQSGEYGDRSFNASFSSDESAAHASDEPRSNGEVQGVGDVPSAYAIQRTSANHAEPQTSRNGPSSDPSSSESSSASILNTPSPPRPSHPSNQTRTEPPLDIPPTTPVSPLKTRGQRLRESKTPNSTEEEQSE